jgi:outer membrane protein OmpA-like peptidoglycan-associated protein
MKKKTALIPAFIFIVAALSSQHAEAQLWKKVKDEVKNRTERKVVNKAGDATDKAIDDAMDGKAKTGTESTDATTEKASSQTAETKSATAQPQGLQYTSKYDFVQGEKVIAYEDLSNAAVGDFPTRWNTNGSAEVVTINKKEGKWLKIGSKGVFFPEFIKNIPENSTLEFDLGVSSNFAWGNDHLTMQLTHLDEKENFTHYSNPLIGFRFHPLTGKNNKTGGVSMFTSNTGTANLHNEANADNWDNQNNLFAHVSLWRQGQRIRMYVNGEKVYDLPRALKADAQYTDLVFSVGYFKDGLSDYYLLGNLRLAEGAPDTRNKLITEGKFVTSGITFDVNSDKIKPESAGVLKEIGTALTENPTVKIKIIGHTDTDGEDAANLDLSKRRAAAVKKALADTYGIDASRMVTDGKGETVPVADNKTAEGKAQNRRVEFVKQ